MYRSYSGTSFFGGESIYVLAMLIGHSFHAIGFYQSDLPQQEHYFHSYPCIPLGTALIEELIVECRRTFMRAVGTRTSQGGLRPRRHQICVTLQECLRGHIHFYEAVGFDVDRSVSDEGTSCTYDLSRDSCRLLVEKHAYRTPKLCKDEEG